MKRLQIRPNVYVIVGAGGNVVMHVGEEGVILVDSGSAAMADQVLAEMRKITNASDSPDHQHERRSRITSAATNGLRVRA